MMRCMASYAYDALLTELLKEAFCQGSCRCESDDQCATHAVFLLRMQMMSLGAQLTPAQKLATTTHYIHHAAHRYGSRGRCTHPDSYNENSRDMAHGMQTWVQPYTCCKVLGI